MDRPAVRFWYARGACPSRVRTRRVSITSIASNRNSPPTIEADAAALHKKASHEKGLVERYRVRYSLAPIPISFVPASDVAVWRSAA
jgi:hypothetical protein